MPRSAIVSFIVTGMIALGWTYASIVPGWFPDMAFLAILGILSLGFWIIILGFPIWWLLGRREVCPGPGNTLRKLARPWKHVLVILLILMLTFVLDITDVTVSLAFSLSRPDFDQLVAKHREEDSVVFDPPQRVGFYSVREIRKDANGGVYVSVNQGSDFIDILTFGFCRNPDSEGSPFGAKYYEPLPLSGGWFLFEASDDWY